MKQHRAPDEESKNRSTAIPQKTSPRIKKAGSENIPDLSAIHQTLFDIAPEGIMILDAQTGQIVDVNAGLTQMLNCTRREFLSRTFSDVLSMEDISAYNQAICNLRIQKHVFHQHVPLKTKDGKDLHVSFDCHLFESGGRDYAKCVIRKQENVSETGKVIEDFKTAEENLRKSEEKYLNILENIEDGYYEADLAGNFTFFNQSICHIWGYTKEELLGMNNRRYMDQETAAKLYKAHNDVYKTGKPGSQFDYEIIRKDGSKRIVQSSFSLLRDDQGNPVGFRGIIRDVTSQKQAEEALRKSEEKYRQAFSSTSDVIFMVDYDLRITSITPSVEKILGYSPEEMTNRRVDELPLLSPSSQAMAVENIRQIFAGEAISNAVFEFIARDGSLKFGEIMASPIRQNGSIIGMIAIARDITRRQLAEEELRQKELFLRKSQEVAHMGSYDYNVKTGNWVSSSVLDDLFGIDSAYPKNFQGWLDIIHPDDQETMKRYLIEHVVKNKNAFEKEYRIIRKSDGRMKWVHGLGELTFDEGGSTSHMIGTIQDVTQRRKMEEDLVKSEMKYRTIVENSQEGIFQASPESPHTTVNSAFAAMLGYDSTQEAQNCITNIPKQVYVDSSEYQKVLDVVLRDGGIKGYETEFYRRDKSRIWVNMSVSAVRDTSGNLLYYHGIVEDITPKKKLEQERQESIHRLRRSLGATINAMSATVEARDPYTAGHQRRVADLARAIATEMNLSRDQIDGIRLAGMIHDIGKISVPSEILTKPTRLTTLEFELIKTHSEAGFNILKDIEFPWPIARIVLEHHERINGTGYPQGLKGEDILLESKIIAVADVVEAISSNRPYRPAFGITPALDEIAKNSGVLYDQDAAESCLKLFGENRYKMPF